MSSEDWKTIALLANQRAQVNEIVRLGQKLDALRDIMGELAVVVSRLCEHLDVPYVTPGTDEPPDGSAS